MNIKSFLYSAIGTAMIAGAMPAQAATQTMIVAGGCFWCVESDFEKVDGVSEVVSGYIGGSAETANYKAVSRTETGHYEAVKITFDDEKSNAIRAHYQNYEANNVEGLQALWSSELELYPNSTEAIGVAEISDFVNAHHENFSDIKLTWGEEDDGIDVWVETASYDNGFTVTQTWFNWVATGKNSGDSYNVPFHITFVWDENGKIAQEYHFGVDQLEKEMAAASDSEE